MLPHDHPQRYALNDEVHARPPEALEAPLRLSFLALFSPGSNRDAEWRHVAALAGRFGVAGPEDGADHFSAELGPFRLKWERHTEFSRYSFIVAGVADPDWFTDPAIDQVPEDWLQGLCGELIVATHIALVRGGNTAPDYDQLSHRYFAGHALVGSQVAGGAATALTDFRIHNGFSRVLILDTALGRQQAGRTVQRLLEIDTYRMLALLALPVARRLAPFLGDSERELAEVTTALASSREADEPELLDRITRLQAAIESRHADTQYRFAAAAAYYMLVRRRIDELREVRIQGLQTFREFTERRLAPAMNTCEAVARRQGTLSERMARATQVLSTRVDVARQTQNQAVLASMNRRARLQLRLQQTVEGLSIAAITYYVVSIVGYAARSVEAAGYRLNADLAVGISIPVVAILVAFGVQRIRKIVTREHAA